MTNSTTREKIPIPHDMLPSALVTGGPLLTDVLSAQSVRPGTKILSESSARRVNIVNEMADSSAMTQTLKTAALVLLAAAALVLGIQVGAQIAPVTDVTPQVSSGIQVQMHRIDALPTQVDAAEPLDESQAEAAYAAADRVCEGMTAGVPLYLMDAPIAREGGMNLQAAHTFVTRAAQACLAAAAGSR